MANSIISHNGELNSQVLSRAINQGATALSFGEVIGFSGSINELFTSWLLSPEHYAVINDSRWNWVGYSLEERDGVFVAVINFSSGILGSTVLSNEGDYTLLKGEYISSPKFDGKFEIIDYTKGNNLFELIVKPTRDNFFIYVYNKNGVLTDRVDIFFN